MPTFVAPLWRWPTPKGILMVTVPEEVFFEVDMLRLLDPG